MAHRPDFSMRLETEPAIRMCDVCAEMCEGSRLVTLIGTSPQSDVCMGCARLIVDLLTAAPKRIERDSQQRRREPVTA